MTKNILLTCLGIVLGFGIAIAIFEFPKRKLPALTTEYQLVLLSNGQAYFGQLEGFGTSYPILRNVFYIRSQQDNENKQIKSSLVKRGKEWHEPDRMILDAQDIVLIEPVSPKSTVAKLINEAKTQ